MGGVKGGEIASSVAVKIILHELKMNLKPDLQLQNIKSVLATALKKANDIMITIYPIVTKKYHYFFLKLRKRSFQ